ncbi:hypothetical protein [Streptomyces sp. NBC_00046]|uniref:hypothetical protein n=1 Tax=unclassified Streptomyces TaxID=2593676 RepID=UPI0032551EC7
MKPTDTADATRATVRKVLGLRLAGDTEALTALFADEVDRLLAESPSRVPSR